VGERVREREGGRYRNTERGAVREGGEFLLQKLVKLYEL
jgi:hypothetical protein